MPGGPSVGKIQEAREGKGKGGSGLEKDIRVLVTGGAGFLGSVAVRRLVADGIPVRVVDNLRTGRLERLGTLPVEVRIEDVRDPGAMSAAMAGITHVVHLAALASVVESGANASLSHSLNVGGTVAVLEAALRQGVRRLVFASSSAVYGEGTGPLSVYGADKQAAEVYLRLYARRGLSTVALRFFNLYGPGQDPRSPYAAVIPRFLAAARTGVEPIIYGDGEQTRDFLHVADGAEAIRLALWAEAAPEGEVLDIGLGTPVSIGQLWQQVAAVCGSALSPRHLPERPGEIRHSCCDPAQAAARLGFGSRIALEEGIRDLWQKGMGEGGRERAPGSRNGPP